MNMSGSAAQVPGASGREPGDAAVTPGPESPYMSYIPPVPEIHPIQPAPEISGDTRYLPGFLSTQIGKIMRVELLLGEQVREKIGRLLDVGATYILLESADSYTTVMCDLYSIKFVTIIDTPLSGYASLST